MTKNIAGLSVYFLVVTALVSLVGCGSRKEESWAYSHEPSKETIALFDNGEATYKGNEYSYVKDDEYIRLTDDEGNETDLRYKMEDDTMLLYEKSTYNLASTNNDGIIGTWVQDNGWSYQFTENGEFSEENIFYGHYSIDEQNNCIKLMYNDPLEDAYLYYSLDGDKLTIDYPWPMVKTKS